MKLLIVGDYGVLSRSIINTVSKAGWETCLLVGQSDSEPKPAKVFEQYFFPYDSDSIAEVVTSVVPDIVLFMGAYDASFPWDKPDQARISFFSGLINVLEACSKVPRLRFFFLSSQEVYGQNQQQVSEKDRPHPDTERGALLLHGERTCELQRQITGLDAYVIRLDHPYGLLESSREVRTSIEQLLIDACVKKEFHITNRHRYSGIFVLDAVEGVYRIIAAKEHVNRLYHLSSEEPVTDEEIAQMLRRLNPSLVITRDEDTGEETELILTCELVRGLFGLRIRNHYADVIGEVYKHIRNNLSSIASAQEMQERKRDLGIKLNRFVKLGLPYFINILGAIAAFFGQTLLVRGGFDRYIDLPFIYTLLISGLFGKQHALIAAVSLSVMHFASAGSLFDLLIDYNTYIWVAKVFIGGMLVGNLRDRQDVVERESDEENNYLQVKLDEMKRLNSVYQRVNRAYENRLIEYTGSLGRIYKITNSLNVQQPGEVLFSAALSVAELMQTRDVAIYQVANGDYCRLFSSTSEAARAFGKTVKYTAYPDLAKAMAETRVFVNKQMLPMLPQMANGIYDGDQLRFIIMVWGLSLDKMTLYQANQLTILSYLIMMSVNRASAYLDALVNKRFIAGTSIMSPDAFKETLDLYRSAKSRHLADYSLLLVNWCGDTIVDTSVKLRTLVRSQDLIGQDDAGRIYLLLLNANSDDADVVIGRLAQAGLGCRAVKEV